MVIQNTILAAIFFKTPQNQPKIGVLGASAHSKADINGTLSLSPTFNYAQYPPRTSSCCEKVILSPNFAVKAENWRFLAHAAANLPVFGPEPALEGHMNRFFCAYSFVTGLQ